MKTVSKTVTGALAAVLLTTAVATPAEAQRYRRHRGGDNISLGDVVLGTIVVGGVVAAVGALSNANRDRRYEDGRYEGGRYRTNGYGYDRYGDSGSRGDRQASIEACAYEAEREAGQRYGGRAQVRDVDADRSGDGYRVRGTVEVQSDYRYGQNGYGRDRYSRGDERVNFSCSARGSRVTGFSLGSNYAQGYGY